MCARVCARVCVCVGGGGGGEGGLRGESTLAGFKQNLESIEFRVSNIIKL